MSSIRSREEQLREREREREIGESQERNKDYILMVVLKTKFSLFSERENEDASLHTFTVLKRKASR